MIKHKFTLLIIGLLLFLVLSIGTITVKKQKNTNIETLIFNLLISSGIPAPLSLLIVAQSKHETALGGVPFMSYSYFKRNNLFGYGYVKSSKYQSGDGGAHPKNEDNGHYAKYDTVENSILEIAAYYKRKKVLFFPIQDQSTFVAALKSVGYFSGTSTIYTAGVKKFYKSNFS